MDPVTILTLVTFCVSSSASLYNTLDRFKSRKQDVRNLKTDIGNLNTVLQALAKKLSDTTEDFEIVRLVLQRCGRACEEFEATVLDNVKLSESRINNIKAWAKLQYLGGDINDFRQLIANYQATISIALAESNLRTTSITKDLLEEYTEMVQYTNDDLEEQIAGLSDKIDALRSHQSQNPPTETDYETAKGDLAAEETFEQKASLEQCLAVCHQVLNTIAYAGESIVRQRTHGTKIMTQEYVAHSAENLAPRLTRDALQICMQNINTVAQHLRDLHGLQNTQEKLRESQIIQQLNGGLEGLNIIGLGQKPHGSVFADIRMGEDSFVSIASTRQAETDFERAIMLAGSQKDTLSFVDSGIATSELISDIAIGRNYLPQRNGNDSGDDDDAEYRMNNTMSGSDGPELIASSLDDIGSQTSSICSPAVLAAQQYLMDRLAVNQDLCTGIQLLQEHLDYQSLKESITDLLKLYCIDLNESAATSLEHAGANLLRSRSYRTDLAVHLIECSTDYVQPDTDSENGQVRFRGVPKSREYLEKWLNENVPFAGDVDWLPSFEEVAQKVKDSTSEAQLNANHNDHNDGEDLLQHPNVAERAFLFMVENKAFARLLQNLYSQSTKKKHVELRDKLMTLPTSAVHFHYREDSSWFDDARHYIEAASGTKWNWWPLSPSRRALSESDCRIIWTCYCGSKRYRDVPNHDASRLQCLIQVRCEDSSHKNSCVNRKPQRRHLGLRQTLLQQCLSSGMATLLVSLLKQNNRKLSVLTKLLPIFLIVAVTLTFDILIRFLIQLFSSLVDSAGPAWQSWSPSSHNKQSLNQPNPKQPSQGGASATSNNNAGILNSLSVNISDVHNVASPRDSQVTVLPICIDQSRLLLGLKQKWNIAIDQIDLKGRAVINDDDFMRRLHSSYKSLRGTCKRWLSVYQLETMEYRHFHKQRSNYVGRGDVNKPLPVNTTDYEYRDPPISAGDFQCFLNFCSRNCWLTCLPWHLCNPPSDELTLLDRVPKKKSLWEIQTKGHGYAWGLECRLEISFLHNLVYHILIFACGFTFWGLWESRYPGDLQNATTPLALIIGLVSLYWTSLGFLRTSPT